MQNLCLPRTCTIKDKDGSGTIDAEELTEMVYDQGYFLSDEEVAAAVVLLDKDGSGKIEYPEFKLWWAKDKRFEFLQLGEDKLKVIQQLTEYFKYFDKNSNGKLSREEFKEMCELKQRFVEPSRVCCNSRKTSSLPRQTSTASPRGMP